MKPSNLNSTDTEVADPLRPLIEWDLVSQITCREIAKSSSYIGVNDTTSELLQPMS